MVLTLQDLPPELLHLALQYLPISDLLSFARSSTSNYQLSTRALTTLDLAVFPRRIHSLLAFFDTMSDDEEDEDHNEDSSISKSRSRGYSGDKSQYQVGLTTPTTSRPGLSRATTPPSLTGRQRKALQSTPASPPPTALSLRTAEITSQNTIAAAVLSTPTLSNLRTLTLRLYDLTSLELARTLSTFTTLHTLNLEFSHPYIHDTTLPARYWKEAIPTGTPIWNALAGVGATNHANLKLHSLRSLRLHRSGITSFQLRHWIMANPDLRALDLKLCRGVDDEFVAWLATYLAPSPGGQGRLDTLRLTDCSLLTLQSAQDFAWVSDIATSGTVRELSLRGCKGVNEEMFLRLAKGRDATRPWRGISKLVSPRGVVVRHGSSEHENEDGVETSHVHCRGGNVSPALTVSDGMVGSGRLGKIEVDPDMEL